MAQLREASNSLPMLPFSKLNKTYLEYFDPEMIVLDGGNK